MTGKSVEIFKSNKIQQIRFSGQSIFLGKFGILATNFIPTMWMFIFLVYLC